MAKCIETRPVSGCWTDISGNRQTVFIHVIYEEGKPIGQAYTTADDVLTPIDVNFAGGETVTAGACEVAQPDVEWVKMCDKQLDGTVVKFICRTITYFDSSGNVSDVSVSNFELDKTTPYTPVGEVGNCESDCEEVGILGTVLDWNQF